MQQVSHLSEAISDPNTDIDKCILRPGGQDFISLGAIQTTHTHTHKHTQTHSQIARKSILHLNLPYFQIFMQTDAFISTIHCGTNWLHTFCITNLLQYTMVGLAESLSYGENLVGKSEEKKYFGF